MTLSAVEICNLALSEVPAKRIVSLNDNSVAANACKEQFTQAVEELMEMGEWGFATRRVRLSEIPNTRDGWAYAYAAPNDMAFPLCLGEDFSRGRSRAFDFEDGVIWCHEPEALLAYITRSPAFASMTAMFRRGLATVLASRLVMPITRDAGRKRELLQEAEVWRDRALARSLNANGTQNTYGDNFIPSSLVGAVDQTPVPGFKPYRPSSDPEYGQGFDFVDYIDGQFP